MTVSWASFLSSVGIVYITVIEAILISVCPGQPNVIILFKASRHFVLSLPVSRGFVDCVPNKRSVRMDRIWAEQEEKFQLIKNKQGECFGR